MRPKVQRRNRNNSSKRSNRGRAARIADRAPNACGVLSARRKPHLQAKAQPPVRAMQQRANAVASGAAVAVVVVEMAAGTTAAAASSRQAGIPSSAFGTFSPRRGEKATQ